MTTIITIGGVVALEVFFKTLTCSPFDGESSNTTQVYRCLCDRLYYCGAVVTRIFEALGTSTM